MSRYLSRLGRFSFRHRRAVLLEDGLELGLLVLRQVRHGEQAAADDPSASGPPKHHAIKTVVDVLAALSSGGRLRAERWL